MKRLFIILMMFLTICIDAHCRNIRYVEKKNYYYVMYDDNNRIIKSISIENGDFIGYSSKYMILSNNGYYMFYDENGKRFLSLSISNIGRIVKISDDYFIHHKDPYLMNYNVKTRKDKVINFI